jgi:hypothetical protein
LLIFDCATVFQLFVAGMPPNLVCVEKEAAEVCIAGRNDSGGENDAEDIKPV